MTQLTHNQVTDKSGIYVDRRKYKLNESFFEIIDSEEKAYWLGFLMADGSVRAGQSQDGTGHWNIRLSLATADKERIERFIEAIGGQQSNN